MASANVRFSRGVWVVDVSQTVDGKRKRSIKAFGAGAKAKAAAKAYRDELAPQAKIGKFWERQTMTFRQLWEKFDAHELASGERAMSTIIDYRAVGRLYLIPHFGDRLLSEIDTETISDFKTQLQTNAGAKAAGKEGSGKALSARSVAKILILLGQVWKFGRVTLKVVEGAPAADVKKPRAAKKAVYVLEPSEIARLRAAFDVFWERLLVELDITTGLRSGEIRGLTWDCVDLVGGRIFVKTQATRHRDDAATKTEAGVRTIPIPAYLIPDLKRWKLQCPPTAPGLVFPGEPDLSGVRGPIDADKLLRNVLRRALSRAGLPPIRFHDLRHLYGSLASEAGVPPKRAQELLGHADIRTTLGIYTHAMLRKHDDSADKMAQLAGLGEAGNKVETIGAVDAEEEALSDCSIGSPGWNRTNDQRINSPTLYR